MPFIAILLFGILSSCFALIFELVVTGFPGISLISLETFSFKALLILLGIAGIEEISKYTFLQQYAARFLKNDTTEPTLQRATLLGVIFGIGFALLEVFLIQTSTIAPSIFDSIGTMSLHIVTSIIFAVLIFSYSEKHFSPFWVLSGATFLHLAYNAAILFL